MQAQTAEFSGYAGKFHCRFQQLNDRFKRTVVSRWRSAKYSGLLKQSQTSTLSLSPQHSWMNASLAAR
jgi:hypothetical protein